MSGFEWSSRLAVAAKSVPPSGTLATRAHADAAARTQGIEVLRLIGSPRDVPAPHVVEAIRDAAHEHILSPSNGLPELRAAIARKLQRELGLSVDPDTEILVTNGAKQALHLAFSSVLDPGDEVLIPAPAYVYGSPIRLIGGVPRFVLMSEVDGYRLDHARLEASVGPRTKALLINTPVNPTGRVLTRAELEGVAEVALRHDLLVVSDEAHARLVYDAHSHISIATLPEMADRTVSVHTFSKAYCLMGYRIGFAVAKPDLIRPARKLLELMSNTNNFISQRAALAVLDGPQDWLDDLQARCQQNRDRLVNDLHAVDQFSFVEPEGGTTLFLNTSQLAETGQEFADFMLERFGVPMVPGHHFGEEGHVRLSAFGSSPEVVETAARRLAEGAEALAHRDRATSRTSSLGG